MNTISVSQNWFRMFYRRYWLILTCRQEPPHPNQDVFWNNFIADFTCLPPVLSVSPKATCAKNHAWKRECFFWIRGLIGGLRSLFLIGGWCSFLPSDWRCDQPQCTLLSLFKDAESPSTMGCGIQSHEFVIDFLWSWSQHNMLTLDYILLIFSGKKMRLRHSRIGFWDLCRAIASHHVTDPINALHVWYTYWVIFLCKCW